MNLPLFCKGAVITVNGEEAVRVASTQDAKQLFQTLVVFMKKKMQMKK